MLLETKGPAIKQPIIDAGDLVAHLAECYDLPEEPHVELIRRGFNDHYLVRAGKDFVLRVYLNGKYYIRGHDDFLYELEWLEYLDANGFPAAAPIRRRDGALLGEFRGRHTTLFRYADGQTRASTDRSPHLMEDVGRHVARLHLLADDFESPHGRYELDYDCLIGEPLDALSVELGKRVGGDIGFFDEYAQRLRDALVALGKSSGVHGVIHADLHGRNIHVTDDGRLTFFDFDHCGRGWRAYDLCTFYRGPTDSRYLSFLRGYESVRPLSHAERDMIPVFRQVRSVWNFGDVLRMASAWGASGVDDDELREAVELLRSLVAEPALP
ncbi:MAG: phosphotransferase [Candidatus Poribacteria bacterium]